MNTCRICLDTNSKHHARYSAYKIRGASARISQVVRSSNERCGFRSKFSIPSRTKVYEVLSAADALRLFANTENGFDVAVKAFSIASDIELKLTIFHTLVAVSLKNGMLAKRS